MQIGMNVSIKRGQSKLVCSAECEKGRVKPNIEDYREYSLSLGDDVEEMFWIGVNAQTAPDELLKELTRNSYEVVKKKYNRQNKE